MMQRRQLLKALGMGGLASMLTLGGRRASRAADMTAPKRVIYFVTAHGHTPNSWMMDIPGGSSTAFAERSLTTVAQDDLGLMLRPLYPFRDQLLITEGLANTINLSNIELAKADHTDINNHSIAVAGLLTGNLVQQTPGGQFPCTGFSRTIDQELAVRTAAPGRYGSRVYAFDYKPNSTIAPFSFTAKGVSSPSVTDPVLAFNDLLGTYTPPTSSDPMDRASRLAKLRSTVLDTVGTEYDFLAARLDTDGKQRLDAHRQLIRELELSLGAGPSALCDPTFDNTGDTISKFSRLIRMAFACDLTRVVTFVPPVPQCTDFAEFEHQFPNEAQVHTYAHESMKGGSACGAQYMEIAETAIHDLGVYYAKQFAYLLEQLDSVIEGNGTMLDNTAVVWLTELATPHHWHHDTFAIVAGGKNLGFKPNRYVRYPRTFTSPQPNHKNMDGTLVKLGPAMNRLHVSVLNAMGETDTAFGLTSVADSAGGTIPLTGRLDELFT